MDILDSAAFLATGLLDSGPYNPPAGQAGGIAAVPEPSLTGLGLLVAAGAVLLSRRRLPRLSR